MSVNNPKISRIRLVAAKIETSTGVAESVVATDAKMITLNPKMVPDIKLNERELPADLGQASASLGAQAGTFTCDVHVAGNGASGLPDWATIFLPACDYVATGSTFAPRVPGSDQQTLTIVLYEDGMKRTLAGARGTFKVVFKTGEPAVISFEFKGKYESHADASILSPAFPTVIPPVFQAATLTVGGFTPTLSQFTIDAGNEITLREDETDATAYLAAAIVNRKPVGSMDPETKSVASKDWLAILKAGTEQALNLVLGSAANNTITITSSHLQLRKFDRGDRNGLMTDALDFQFNTNAPLAIAFS